MEVFLKWYYGYKNFGDELLFFGLANWIATNFDISNFVVEAGDQIWLEDWIKDNKIYLGSMLDKIEVVPINPYKMRYFSHAMNLLWLWKYKNFFKFFGWGEVLDDSRKFPHDGRNIALLYNRTIRKKNFILLWWIWSTKKTFTKYLYNFVIPKAQSIVCREKVSYNASKLYNQKAVLYQDFSYNILKKFEDEFLHQSNLDWKYILINITPKSFDPVSLDKIIKFCNKYPDHKKIFFPCDISDDMQYFMQLKKHIKDLDIYNWTKHNLTETLQLFYNSDGGIWARLHFLYPLKIFKKNYQALVYEEKIEKMIG